MRRFKSGIPRQTDLDSQNTANIRSEPAASRGYHTLDESADQVERARAKNNVPRKVDVPTHTFRSFEVRVTSKSQTLVMSNEKRRFLLIQNKGTQETVQLAFGTQATSNGYNSLDLPPSTSLDLSAVCPNNEINAFCLPTSQVCVVEGFVDD